MVDNVGKKTGGRQKGTPNKITATLREAILRAAENAGNVIQMGRAVQIDGTTAYLQEQAMLNPTAFMALMAKVMPTQISGVNDGPLKIEAIQRTIVEPKLIEGPVLMIDNDRPNELAN